VTQAGARVGCRGGKDRKDNQNLRQQGLYARSQVAIVANNMAGFVTVLGAGCKALSKHQGKSQNRMEDEGEEEEQEEEEAGVSEKEDASWAANVTFLGAGKAEAHFAKANEERAGDGHWGSRGPVSPKHERRRFDLCRCGGHLIALVESDFVVVFSFCCLCLYLRSGL
jgi:hypothetical protein